MAPEQKDDAKHADHRADIYAIGRIIYELYTGDPPSAAQDLAKLRAELRPVVAKCTKQDPARRYSSIAELRSEYELVSGALACRASRGDVVALLKLFVASGPDVQSLARLSRTLAPVLEDKDVVHDVVMRITPDAFAAYAIAYADQARELIRRFAQHVIDSRWGFQYCDRIAERAERLFEVVGDAQIRASVLVMLVELGVANDRPHAIDTFARLLGRIRNREEARVVCGALRSSRPRLAVIRARLDAEALPTPIREWIATPESAVDIAPLAAPRQRSELRRKKPVISDVSRRG